jgi:hypothetical protein
MKKITIEIPDTLDETEVKAWVQIKVERHLRAIKEPEVQSVDALIKPDLDDYKEKNGLTEVTEVVEEVKIKIPAEEIIK